jgi:hypothetical protein
LITSLRTFQTLNSAYYFNRLFRSRFGGTPSDVRAEAQRHLGDHPPIA